MMRRGKRGRIILWAIAHASFVIASVVHASTDDPFGWRHYLTAAEWKEFDLTLQTFTNGAGMLAAQKDACGIEDEARNHFVKILTGTHLIRAGAEIEDQEKKYDAWRTVMRLPHCNFSNIEPIMKADTRYLTDMLNIQKTGLSRKASGEVPRR